MALFFILAIHTVFRAWNAGVIKLKLAFWAEFYTSFIVLIISFLTFLTVKRITLNTMLGARNTDLFTSIGVIEKAAIT
jgi:hypothetical protein